jgi:hypothetical protein
VAGRSDSFGFIRPLVTQTSFNATSRFFPFDSKPPFVAMSYAWGDARYRRDIEVSRKRLSVAVNLFKPIRHVATLLETRIRESRFDFAQMSSPSARQTSQKGAERLQ